MPLHDSFKTTAGANVRLTKLASIPSIQDLDFAMAQASKHPRAIIELPWKAASSPTTFVLRVSTADGSEEGPSWTLHAGESLDAAVLWSHDSMDTFLIQSLISAEGDPNRALQTYVDTSKQAPALEEPTPPPRPGAPVRSARPDLPAPVELDRGLLEALQWQMRRQETGLFSEAYAYHLLIQEFNRYQRYQTPFAFVLFELALKLNDGTLSLPPVRLLHESANRIQGVGRVLDCLCHYKDPKLCLVLPHTGCNEAMQLCARIEEALLSSPLAPGLDRSNICICFGVASVPDTCEHPGILIAAAQEALEQAKRTGSTVVLFPSS
ncbi:MAG TPA: diguanylate cyclase [Candidatus Obscuribacter sp.]|nr:diguanylate cyclase [Candidatus Obscuribacter sp.]